MRPFRRALPLLLLGLLSATPADAHELGLNIHLSSTVGPSVTKDAGLKWVRIDMNWDIAQPADAAPDFSQMDAVVNAARAKGLSVLAVLGYTPAWASSGNGDGMGAQNDVPVAGKYEAFVSLAVAHFKDRVTHYELWNEPNLTQFFEGTKEQYLSLILKPGADALRAQCASCKVVGPGLASLSAGKYDEWLDAILKQANDKIDIVNGHAYAGFSEDDPNVGVTSDSFLNKLESHRVIKLGSFVVYEGPRSFKEVMDQNGVTKPFWLTETGLEAPIGDAARLDRQKLFYRRVLEKATTRPWWTTTIFYEAFDTPSPMYTWGIAQDTGGGAYTKKPVFDFLKNAATGMSFGGSAPPCSDFLDNDGDGKIDFPDDTDCFDPNGGTEGALIVLDMANTMAPDGGFDDAGFFPGDGGTSGQQPGPGGTQSPPVDRGCAFAAAAAPGPLAFAWLVALLVRRRRRGA